MRPNAYKVIAIAALIPLDPEFADMCLLKVYEKQEADEQDELQTKRENMVGFNRADAHALSYAAKEISNHVPLSEYWRAEVNARLPKYSKQILSLLTEQEIDSWL